ncbi:MAG: hypothetical protein CAF45_013130 [Nitrospira sp. CG24E]|nr:MAG: hypothetical protein CAF45_013130 [Nitrospira sp. CG24E]
MSVLWCMPVLLLTIGSVGEGLAQESLGVRPLLAMAPKDLHTILPPGSHILIEPRALEQFLDALDKTPPDWGLVYGHGHHDSARDERLFTLNRERDAKRVGNPALAQRITFVWDGELSRYDAEAGGFRVVIGPKFTPTRWGVVRFKYEDFSGNLVAKVSTALRGQLERRIARGESIAITVAMTGRLIPEESVLYDFSHDQEGLGVIMPIVKVEQLDYLLTDK